jgi:hypoxanthine phosphoribosyltransferase
MKKEENSIYNYSWKAFEADVKVLLKKIDFSNYDILVGVAKGGLPLLTTLLNRTKLNNYEIIRAYSYEGREHQPVTIDLFCKADMEDKRVLVVDDVADTGGTLKEFKRRLTTQIHVKSVEFLTLFYKPQSVVIPEWYLHEVENWQWIKFPWE